MLPGRSTTYDVALNKCFGIHDQGMEKTFQQATSQRNLIEKSFNEASTKSDYIVCGRLCQNGLISKKKVSFDFAIALCSIGAPDIPKNFAQLSEMENMVF